MRGCPRGGRAPTRGAPTVGYGVPARGEGTHKGGPYGMDEGCPRGGEGTHKGCPYGWMMWARTRGGGHPQGAPLRLDDVGAHTGGRAPTRGAPTVGYGVPAKGGGHPQGVPLPDSDSLTWVCPNLMQFPWGEQRGYARRAWVRRGRPRTEGGGRWSGAGETPAAPGCSPAARLNLPDNH